MTEGGGFTSMAGARAEGDAPEIGIGILGYAFMGKAHSNAFKKIPYMMYPPAAIPKLVGISGRNEAAVAEAAKRYGYENYYTDWREMIANPDIHVFDNGGPNNFHAEPTIAAAEAGKHVFCEKPLGRTAEESMSMLAAAEKAGVKHMVAFNYRFVPAIVQARKLIESGALGRIYHWRAVYLQGWGMDPSMEISWRFQKDIAGSGALGDLGAHIIDLARFLVGEPKSVMGYMQNWMPTRPDGDGNPVTADVDDGFVAAMEFENGALGTVESTRFAQGRKNYNSFEINAENGSIKFNLERLNELEVFWAGDEPDTTQGFHNVLVSEPNHPYWENWWPQGHMIGWEHSFVHEFDHFFRAIVNDTPVDPYGATFLDGYRNSVICDAIAESSQSGRRVDIQYEK
ncbi:MAG: Gfo/Idh/MocA family oxidoreductase [Chloroflexota bacterium]